MKTKELRDLSPEDLKAREEMLRRELFSLRMRHATGQLENPVKLRLLRRDIARVKTIIAEKTRGA